MPRDRSPFGLLCGLAATLNVCAFLTAAQTHAKVHARAPAVAPDTPSALREHQSEHFLITTDSSPDVVAALTAQLESTYVSVMRFARRLDIDVHDPPARLPVTLFDRYDDFRAALRAAGLDDGAFVGFYDQASNRSMFCNIQVLPQVSSLPAGPQRDALLERIGQLVIAHETAHQVLFNIGLLTRGADHRDWLVEGLACLFEQRSPTEPDSIPLNILRLADLREALAADRLPELTNLISEFEVGLTDPATMSLRYAHAWGLVEFLRQRHAPAFAAFLRSQAAHPPRPCRSPAATPPPTVRSPAAQRLRDFESAFGPPDENAFLHWLQTLPKTGQ